MWFAASFQALYLVPITSKIPTPRQNGNAAQRLDCDQHGPIHGQEGSKVVQHLSVPLAPPREEDQLPRPQPTLVLSPERVLSTGNRSVSGASVRTGTPQPKTNSNMRLKKGKN